MLYLSYIYMEDKMKKENNLSMNTKIESEKNRDRKEIKFK